MLHTTYSAWLIALSVVMGGVASYTALDLAGRVVAASGRSKLLWLVGSALSMGFGIWSMHFLGMLAFRISAPLAYNAPQLALSIVIAGLARPRLHWQWSRSR